MNPYILYHAKCQDGLGAKYAAHKKFGENANYIAVNYHEPIPDIPADADVFIVDFSYPKTVLLEIKSRVNTLMVLDHHKTAQEELMGLEFAYFDMNKSGAVLAWEYFHPGIPVPQILLRIQDRDIWKWQYRDTKEVLATLSNAEDSFDAWDLWETAGPQEMARAGEGIVSYQDLCVRRAMDSNVRVSKWKGWTVAVVNTTHMHSEIGADCCKNLEVDFAVIWSMAPEGVVKLGFRSLGDFDVSAIAKTLGGGGHKNAAGASAPISILSEFY